MTHAPETAVGAAPDQAARETALDITRNVLVVAPAGSGKTTLLVMRFLKCLALSREPEEVLAITFTNKAAAEIRSRLVAALRQARADEPAGSAQQRELRRLARAVAQRDAECGWALLDNPNRLRALTIDSLNGELAAQLPLLSGLGGRLGIAEDARGLYEDAILALFEEIEEAGLAPEDVHALRMVLRHADNRIDLLLEPLADMLGKREQWLEGLLDERALDTGSDTRVLQALALQRLQRLDRRLDPAVRGGLVTLLRTASAEAESLAWAANLPGWPAATLENFESWRALAGCLLVKDGRRPALLRIVNKRHGFPPGRPGTRAMKSLLDSLNETPGSDDLAEALAEVRDFPPFTYPPQLREHRVSLSRTLLRLAGHLKLVFSRRGETDFTEIALSAVRALSGEHGYSETLDRADARIRHLLVDEMQDTSEGQVQLFKRLTSGWVPGDGHSLFMVGDPQQSIYAFRKAEVRLFQELWDSRHLEQLPLTCVELSANFRSSPSLIDWFNAAFSRIFPEQADAQLGGVAYSPCVAARPPAARPEAAVRILAAWQDDDPSAEANAVLARVQELRAQHGEAVSIAILARTRRQLHRVIAALRDAGLSLSCQDIDPLHDLPAVRDYVSLARALWHPEDRLAWAVLLRSPLVGLSHADLVALSRGTAADGPRRSWPQKIHDALAGDRVSTEGRERLQHLQSVLLQAEDDPELNGQLAARSEAVWHALGGPAALRPDEWTDLQTAMLHLRRAAASGEIESLAQFRRGLANAYSVSSAGAIQVMTVHKAKGLEFDHVLLVGCGQKAAADDKPLLHYRAFPAGILLVPKPPAQLPRDDPAHRLFDFMHRLQARVNRSELLRLLYVGCTRARESLTLAMTLKRGKDDGWQAAGGSFADLLAPLLDADIHPQPTGRAALEPASTEAPPRSPRLPAGYRFVADDPAYRPPERRTLRPSEAALDAQEIKPYEGDRYARLVGTMYHEAMRRIAHEGLVAWQDGGESRRRAMAAGLRHLGLPEPRIAEAVDRVLALLRRTLSSAAGRWLLAPRAWAQAEYALAGYRDGQWVSAIVDRCFEEDGVIWMIDYKTTSEPPAQALERHRDQLQHYAGLLSALHGKPVRSALFLAESGELVIADRPAPAKMFS